MPERVDRQSVWLRAELDILMERVGKRDHRPLLKTKDPQAVMQNLIDQRYPIYALSDIVVESRDVAHEVIVHEILDAIASS